MALRLLALMGPVVLLAASSAGAGAEAPSHPGRIARQLWAVTDLVEANHPEPPSRTAMLHSAIAALFKAAKSEAPSDLDRRLAPLAPPEDRAALLGDV